MRWRDLGRSRNVEDRRGRSGGGVAVGGGMGLLVVLAVALLFGVNPLELLQQTEAGAPSGAAVPTGAPDPADETADFVAAVLGSTEAEWSAMFAEEGAQYQAPVLVLFTDMVRSGCGGGSAAMGPFYCPLDRKVYLDLGFFRELARLGGPGDFAGAYVIGHEVGHHVQTITGTSEEVRDAQGRARNEGDANALSVALELQADCYAGVWAARANRRSTVLEPGDVDEGLAAAAAIGDDRLARSAGRAAAPESFTHGSSEQRQQWLRTGLETGDPGACDTFGR